MSVINKMLRDLDQRQVSDDNGAAQPGATPLRSGTASVPGARVTGNRTAAQDLQRKIAMQASLASAVLAVCGVAGWWWLHQATPQAGAPAAETTTATASAAPAMSIAPATAAASVQSTASAASSVVAPGASASTTAPAAAAGAPPGPAASPAASVAAAKPALAGAAVSVPPLPTAPTMPLSGQAPGTVPVAASVPVAAKPVAVPAVPALPAPLAKSVAATAATPQTNAAQQLPAQTTNPPSAAAPDASTTGQRQQQAARDALAQAQGLWNSGTHDNAIDLLQQAVATAERSAQSTPGAPATQALTSLARELARMQVAQGRPGSSVDMLARLEPLLGSDPDLWAVRANAAQRAGRHQDSVNAYTTALQSRPTEQRWLLGAAVSSAALGQTANAATLADKAAAVGPIAKDVQAYLRQMGVPLKD